VKGRIIAGIVAGLGLAGVGLYAVKRIADNLESNDTVTYDTETDDVDDTLDDQIDDLLDTSDSIEGALVDAQTTQTAIESEDWETAYSSIKKVIKKLLEARISLYDAIGDAHKARRQLWEKELDDIEDEIDDLEDWLKQLFTSKPTTWPAKQARCNDLKKVKKKVKKKIDKHDDLKDKYRDKEDDAKDDLDDFLKMSKSSKTYKTGLKSFNKGNDYLGDMQTYINKKWPKDKADISNTKPKDEVKKWLS
jgi:chromosome segregation ATPase